MGNKQMHTYPKRRYLRHTWEKKWLRYFYLRSLKHFSICKTTKCILMFFFSRTANPAANKIYAIKGEDEVAERENVLWARGLLSFKLVTETLKIKNPGLGPLPIYRDQIKTWIENNLLYPACILAEMLNMTKSTYREQF